MEQIYILISLTTILFAALAIALALLLKHKKKADQYLADYRTVKQDMISLLEKIAFEKQDRNTETIHFNIENLKIDNLRNINVQDICTQIITLNTVQEQQVAVQPSPEETEIIKEFRFYQTAFTELINSIIKKIRETSEPISNEIFSISDNISRFFSHVESYDKELKSNESLKQINQKDKDMMESMDVCSRHTEEMTKYIADNMDKLNKIIATIDSQAQHINEIAENIRVLAINTSIEAVRTSTEGKAFKVIAQEIRKLSENTQIFVREITSTISLSKKSVSAIAKTFTENQVYLEEKMKAQQATASEFKVMLSRFLIQYEAISAIIYNFIDGIKTNILKINPVVQLHEITVQEMENMRSVMMDYFDRNMEKIRNKKNADLPEIDLQYGSQAADAIRKRLTSSRELDSLYLTLRKFGLDEKIALNRTGKVIEFF